MRIRLTMDDQKRKSGNPENSVASSTAYKMASPGVQMAMMSVVEDIADPKELALHQKKLDVLGLVIFPTAVFHGLQNCFTIYSPV